MTYTNDEPPDENEAYENLDEALDEQDLPGHGGGPEGGRDIDTDIVADREALEEVGAELDDPDRISLLDGAMDDPDGSGQPEEPEEPDAGVDTDPAQLESLPEGAPGPNAGQDVY